MAKVTESEMLREMLDEQDIPYEIMDFKTRKITYIECSVFDKPFEIEFNEPLDGIPGTLGAMREITFSLNENPSAEDAIKIILDAISK